MKSLPFPLRVAAGLAVTAVESARTLPAKVVGLPVTVASQALQVSMRVQQQVTELAIRGDEVLAGLSPVEDAPEWATFDEDQDGTEPDEPGGGPTDGPARGSPFDRVAEPVRGPAPVTDLPVTNGAPAVRPDPWAQEERALAEETSRLTDDEAAVAARENYDELSLPQLRARLRRFSVDELAELLEYERAHQDRAEFVGMLTRRIATVRDRR